jgi:hypothetical protein
MQLILFKKKINPCFFGKFAHFMNTQHLGENKGLGVNLKSILKTFKG